MQNQIHKFYKYLLRNPVEQRKMSHQELEYAKKYSRLLEQHFRDSFLQDIPDKMQSLDEPAMGNYLLQSVAFFFNHLERAVSAPNLHCHVYCQVNEDLDRLQLDATYDNHSINRLLVLFANNSYTQDW